MEMPFQMHWSDGQGADGDAYYQLNAWAMEATRRKMAEIGMLHFEGEPSREEWADLDLDHVGPADRLILAEKLLGRSLADTTPGIPEWKLRTGDGWYVRAIEAAGALLKYQEWCEAHGANPSTFVPTVGVEPSGTEPLTWWPTWIAYLTGAVLHGGFRVY